MKTFKGYSKIWFLVLLLVTFVAGCTGNNAAPSSPAITAYSLTGAPGTLFNGTINEPAKTIAVAVPAGTDLRALVATFTTTATGVTVGVTPQTSAVTPNNFTSPVAYTVTAADNSTAIYNVSVTAASITAKAITAYSFVGLPASPGIIDETSKTIALTLPFGTDVANRVATFTTTGAVVTIGTIVQTSMATANNFTNSKEYTVTAADGTTVKYTVTVTLASSSSKAITAYSFVGFAGFPGTINELDKTIMVTLPFGTNLTALTAKFTTTGTVVKIGEAVQTSEAAPTNDFTNSKEYTVIAADLSMTLPPYTVTVILATANPTAPVLGEAARFVILASQAVTTTGTTAISNGDIGVEDQARSFFTGFTDGAVAGQFTELTNGMSYASNDANPAPFAYPLHYATQVVGTPWATTGAMITQAKTDLGIANTFLAADPNPSAPTQVCPIQLGGRTLTRGVYKTSSNVGITTGDLHLDAQGDPNSVFIFSIAGTLTTGAPGGNIILDNGALAKNVYWRTGDFTVIGAGTFFKGNVFAWSQVNLLKGADITGRLFALTDQVTLIANKVTKAP